MISIPRGTTRGTTHGAAQQAPVSAPGLKKRTLSERYNRTRSSRRPQSSVASRPLQHPTLPARGKRPLTSHASHRSRREWNATELYHREQGIKNQRTASQIFNEHSLFEDSLYKSVQPPTGTLQTVTKWSPRSIPQVDSWKRLARPHTMAPMSAPSSDGRRGGTRGAPEAEMATMHAQLQHHLNQRYLNTRDQFRAFQSTNAGVIDIKVNHAGFHQW